MKKIVSILVLVSMFIGLLPMSSFAMEVLLPAQKGANMNFKQDNQYYLIDAEMFTDMGGWMHQYGDVFGSNQKKTMYDQGEGQKNANFEVNLLKDSEYTIFVHTRDFKDNAPGTRILDVLFDNQKLGTVGKHKLEGWAWEKAGTVKATKGKHTLSFADLKKNARFDLVFITDDKDFFPGNTEEDIAKIVTKKYSETTNADYLLPKAPLVSMNYKEDKEYFVITPELIKEKGEMGGWMFQTGNNFKSHRGQTMLDQGAGTDPATIKFIVPSADNYKIYVHSRDFATSSPGTRIFEVLLDGESVGTGGAHLGEGWAWEPLKSTYIQAGEHTLSFVDMSKIGRFDLVLITNDSEFSPDNTYEALTELEAKYLYDESKIEIVKVDELAGRPNTEIAVKFNGEWMTFDVPPMLMNDRTMVPMRAIFERLGCAVSWNNDSETATGDRNGKKVSVTIGSDVAVVDGKASKIDQSAVLVNDRTLVPLRFISEAYGAEVMWDNDNQIVTINATVPATAYYFTDISYSDYGTWSPEFSLSDGSGALIGAVPAPRADGLPVTPADADKTNRKPAVAHFEVAKEGDYRVWVRARDFETNQQGTRYFNVHVNGENTARTYGQHGKTGYHWEDGGIVHLKQGMNTVEALDSSAFYARMAGIFITEDLTYVPSSNHSALVSIATLVDPTAGVEGVAFPRWANADLSATETLSIESDKIKVNFFKVNGDNGQFIQNEILVNDNGNWITSKAKTENFGLLQLRNDNASKIGVLEGRHTAKVDFNYNGVRKSYTTKELYKMGENTWLIPVNAEKIADNKVLLTYEDKNGALVKETWEFDGVATAPKVTLNATFTKDGYYSFVMSNGSEIIDADMEAVTLPFRIFGKRVPDESTMIIAQYMFSPMTAVTVSADKTGFGKQLTKGIVVDGTEIPDWTYASNSKFMAGLRGVSSGVLSTLAAPIMGYDNSKFTAGDTYSFVYRPINEVAGWFDAYKSVSTNVFNFHDGRSNYYTSLNEAVYNATDLMMDDWYGGWDDIHMAHWNEESKGVSTSSSPLIAAQRYLLTENEDIMTRRAIPTFAHLIGRNSYHFKRSMEQSPAVYVPTPPSALGGYNKSFPTSIFAGAYQITKGMLPVMLGVAEEAGTANKITYYVQQNALELYRATGDEKYLEEAKQMADKYISETLEDEAYMTEQRVWESFVNNTYFPDLSCLIDIYEATGEKKYLDAAEKTGQMLAACTWVPGYDNGKYEAEYTVYADKVYYSEYKKEWVNPGSTTHYWHGEEQWNIGGAEGAYVKSDLLPEQETVPGWLPTRVGLGLEQAFSYEQTDSGAVIMSNWASDMVRLAEYTGDEYFYTLAKNAIIGRFGNYSGYYIDRYSVHQMKAEFPYKGPDTTQIYYHHIPPFLAMIEDFLITDAWARSDQAIEFPHVRQHCYAYFFSNHYGFESGRVYDMDDMWLWNDRGIVEIDTVLLNYLPAKKDGKLAIAFMGTDSSDTTANITLGEKIEGGADYSGTATVYDAKGNKSTLEVKNGKFTITVPAKGILTVALDIPTVKAPAYAKEGNIVESTDLGGTVSEHNRGRGYVLQFTPDKYYAYIYTTDMDSKEPGSAKFEYRSESATLTYTVNGKTETVTNKEFPYEFIIPVDDKDAVLTYKLSVKKADGTTEDLGGGTLMTAEKSAKDGVKASTTAVYNPTGAPTGSASSPTATVSKDLPKFEPIKITYVGTGAGNAKLRFIVPLAQFKDKIEIKDNILKNVKASIVYKNIETGKTINVETVVAGNESRTDGYNFTLIIEPTEDMPYSAYTNASGTKNEFEITLSYPD